MRSKRKIRLAAAALASTLLLSACGGGSDTASLAFNWGLSCEGKSGEDLSLVLSNEGTAIIEVTGKLA